MNQEITIDTSDAVNTIKKMIDRVQHLEDFFNKLKPEIYKAFIEHFEHNDWKPLSLYTLAEKEKEGYSAQPLVRTGALKKALQGHSPDLTETIDDNTLIMKITLPYARYLDVGTGGYQIRTKHAPMLRFIGTKSETVLQRTVMRGPLPARPIIEITDANMKSFEEILVKYLENEV